MAMNNSLCLNVPDLTATTHKSFDTDSSKVLEWIEALPLTDVGTTAKEIYFAIIEINQMDIDVNTRMNTTELFRHTIHYIIDNLEKYFIGASFPLSIKARKIAHLCQKLNSELSIAYKLVVKQLIEDKVQQDPPLSG